MQPAPRHRFGRRHPAVLKRLALRRHTDHGLSEAPFLSSTSGSVLGIDVAWGHDRGCRWLKTAAAASPSVLGGEGRCGEPAARTLSRRWRAATATASSAAAPSDSRASNTSEASPPRAEPADEKHHADAAGPPPGRATGDVAAASLTGVRVLGVEALRRDRDAVPKASHAAQGPATHLFGSSSSGAPPTGRRPEGQAAAEGGDEAVAVSGERRRRRRARARASTAMPAKSSAAHPRRRAHAAASRRRADGDADDDPDRQLDERLPGAPAPLQPSAAAARRSRAGRPGWRYRR